MELHQLRAFVHVVESGSFRKAAEQLHVTQAAISHSIKTLETRVGTAVLVRSNGAMSLTEAGQVLLSHARSVLASVDAAAEDLAALQEEGTLRLATFASASAYYLPLLARKFHERFPRIGMEIREGNDLESFEWLKEGLSDISFVVGASSDIQFYPLYDDDFVLVARKGAFPDARSRTLPMSALNGCKMIQATGGCERLVSTALEASGISIIHAAAAREPSTAVALVQADLGSTIRPRVLVPNQLEGVEIFELAPRITRTVGLAVRPGERLAHAAAALLGLVGKTCPPTDPGIQCATGGGPRMIARTTAG